MSASHQRVTIIGNLGVDPEVRYTQSGKPVANLSVATSEKWKDKQSGELREETEWHRLVCYQRLAEIAGEFLRKGSKVYIEGKIKTRKWQGQDGKDNYTTEIIVNDLQMLDSRQAKQQGGQQAQGNQGGFGGQQSQGNQGGFGGQQQGSPQAQGNQGGFGAQQPQGGFGNQQSGANPNQGFGGQQGGFGGHQGGFGQ